MKKTRFSLLITLLDDDFTEGSILETKAYVPESMTIDRKAKVFTYIEKINFPYFISHHEALLDIAKYKIKDLINKDYKFFNEQSND